MKRKKGKSEYERVEIVRRKLADGGHRCWLQSGLCLCCRPIASLPDTNSNNATTTHQQQHNWQEGYRTHPPLIPEALIALSSQSIVYSPGG